MAKGSVPVPPTYPYIYRDYRMRNGQPPDYQSPYRAVRRHNFTLCHQRKIIFTKTTALSDIVAGSAGSVTHSRFYFQTGESPQAGSTISVRAVGIALPSDGGFSSSEPKWELIVGGSTSDSVSYNLFDGSPPFGALRQGEVVISGLAPDTAYEGSIKLYNGIRLVSVLVWEEVASEVEAAHSLYHDPSDFFPGAEILASQHSYPASAHEVFKHNGAQLLSLSLEDNAVPWSTTSLSDVNLLDTGVTAVSATSPGFNIVTQYHNPRHTNNVECVFGAYAQVTGGAGTGAVRLKDSGGTLSSLSIGATLQWYTATGNLDGSVSSQKLDVHFARSTGTQLDVYAVSLFEYAT